MYESGQRGKVSECTPQGAILFVSLSMLTVAQSKVTSPPDYVGHIQISTHSASRQQSILCSAPNGWCLC